MMTKNCIICYQPAKMWTGHVLTKYNRQITAGWCEDHKHLSEDIRLMTGIGCFGVFKKEHSILIEKGKGV